MTIPVSIMILTKNEEVDLPACLRAVEWCDDIHVYDSFSEDSTPEVARRHGALVTQRKFDDWSSHQNWGLQNLPFKYPWVLYIDADEHVTPKLKEGIASAVSNPNSCVAFRIYRRDFFGKTWLKHVQATPYYMRLFRPEKMRYERLSHPVSLPDGPVGDIDGYLDHFPFSKGMAHWFVKHNGYSSFEAKQIVADRRGRTGFDLRKALFSRDFTEKRYHQKEIFYRMPARPLVKFLLLYFLKRGFLDGKAGLTYASLQAVYEYMIIVKTQELEDPESYKIG